MNLVGPVASGLRLLLCHTQLTGVHNLPRRGPALLVVNHTTIVDVVPVLSSLHKAGLRPGTNCSRKGCGHDHGHVRFLATELVFAHSIGGPLARSAGFIPVGYKRPAAQALQAAHESLAAGEIVGIYPEGDVSASSDGAPRPWRSGAARLALQALCPVIPLAQHDSREISTGDFGEVVRSVPKIAMNRPLVRLHVGTPVQPEEFAGLDVQATSDLLFERLLQTWQHLRD